MNELREQAVILRSDGKPYEEVAEQLELSVQEVIDLLENEEVAINTYRAVKMETLITSQQADHKGRIEHLSNLQNRLREELESRDLSTIPTDKLVTLILKTSEALKEEVTPIRVLSSNSQTLWQYEQKYGNKRTPLIDY